MKILVACEYSGTVRDAFIARGHDAISCDIIETEKPGPHIVGDCVEAIKSRRWDVIIMHPPCTALSLSGNAWYGIGKLKHQARIDALKWTGDLWRMSIDSGAAVMLENPANVLGAEIGKRTQSIHPWQFGHMEQKETWLWLHGLPLLLETNNVREEMMRLPKKERERLHYMSPGPNRGKLRAKTFQGIADAMAQQWG